MDKQSIIKLHQSGSLDRARTHYETYLCHNPDDIDVVYLLCILHQQQQEYTLALSYATDLIKAEHQNPNYLVTYANCLSHAKEPKQALAYYDEALRLSPESAPIHNAKGNHFYRMSQIDQAYECYKKAILLNDQLYEAQFNMVLIAVQLKQFDSAIYRLERLIKQNDHLSYRAQLGQLYQQQEKWEQAKKQYLLVLKQDPEHAMTHHRLASIYVQQDNLEQAKEHFKQTLRILPNHSETLHNLASIYLTQKKYPEALSFWHRQLDSDPNATTYYNLGICYYYINRFNDAKIYLEQCIEYDPDYINAYMNLANISLREKRPNDAVMHYEAVVSRQHDNQEARYLLSALKQQGEHYNQSPDQYVKRLFNQYAHHYDKHLIEMLHYQVPQLLFEALEDINALDSNHQQKTVLDLGCGTGLIGQLIHRYTKELIGIDIASEMIKCAKERQIYHQLYQEDILACLNEHFIDANVDLMILGDVFPYIGDMEEYFNVFQQCLKPKGHIAFSIEYQPNDQKKPFLLQPSARFCHSQHYIETLAKSHHLEVVYQRKRVLRRQNDQDIQGMIFILESH